MTDHRISSIDNCSQTVYNNLEMIKIGYFRWVKRSQHTCCHKRIGI